MIKISSLKKIYTNFVAVEDLCLEIENEEFVAFLGPSGCGKTTTLRMVAGFVEPTSGTIEVNGVDVTSLPPERRNMGLVFQNYALFPHLTVRKNIEFGLKCHKVPSREAEARISHVLKATGLETLSGRYPRQLSGGQQQRVAVARVLALKPSLLMFDEPLSNLDATLRIQMRNEIKRLQRAAGVAALFVTHDQEEALALADRVVVMNRGRVEQVGSPEEIYDNPKTRFVAAFIGDANLLDGRITASAGQMSFLTKGGVLLPVPEGVRNGSALFLRPERIKLTSAAGEGCEGKVTEMSRSGPLIHYEVTLNSGELLRVNAHRGPGGAEARVGEDVKVVWDPSDSRVIA